MEKWDAVALGRMELLSAVAAVQGCHWTSNRDQEATGAAAAVGHPGNERQQF